MTVAVMGDPVESSLVPLLLRRGDGAPPMMLMMTTDLDMT